MVNTLKRDLKAGKACLGTVVTLSCPTVAEIFAMAGYDFIWYDLEHTPMSLETLALMLQSAGAYSATPVVRVPGNDEVMIKRVLDLGTQAIIVPLVNTADQARVGVRALKYPPLGVRGAGLGRAQGYGEGYSGDYFKNANDETMFIAQIEHIEAVRNIDAILAVEGVDAVLLGPLDMSGSMGLLGQTSHPEVEAAEVRVLETCRRAGKPAGIMTMSPEQATQRIRQGYRLIGMGIDVDSLLNLARDGATRVDKTVVA